MSSALPLSAEAIAEHNAANAAALDDDYASLGRQLERRGVAIEAIKAKVAAFSVALPTWGVGVGGTRFAKFPIPENSYAANFGNVGEGQQATLNGVPFMGAPFCDIYPKGATASQWGTVQLSGVTDGLSNTMLVSEIIQAAGGDLRGMGMWGDGAGFETYLLPNSTIPDVISLLSSGLSGRSSRGTMSFSSPWHPTGYHERKISPDVYWTASPKAPSTTVVESSDRVMTPAGTRRKYFRRNDHARSGRIPAVASMTSRPAQAQLNT